MKMSGSFSISKSKLKELLINGYGFSYYTFTGEISNLFHFWRHMLVLCLAKLFLYLGGGGSLLISLPTRELPLIYISHFTEMTYHDKKIFNNLKI